MSEELKPCPFCGCVEIVSANYGQVYWCQCKSCKCGTGKFGSRATADHSWNTRAKESKS